MIVQQNQQYKSPDGAVAPIGADENVPEATFGSGTKVRFKDGAWRSDHAINLRLTIPLPFASYYLAIVGGKERRSPERRREERQKHPLATKWNILFLAVFGFITGLAMVTVIQTIGVLMLERAKIL